VSVDNPHDRVDEGIAEVVRLESEVDEFLVFGVVVVCFLLDARVLEMFNLGIDAVGRRGMLDQLGELKHIKLFGELVEHAELAAIGRIAQCQLDTGQCIADVEESAGLAALAVDGHRHATHRLNNEAVEGCAEDGIVVEAGHEPWIEIGGLGLDAVDDALVEVGGANAPNPAGEHDVVAIVDLAEVVERAGLLGKRQGVGATVVGDGDIALFDVDIGRAILAHGAEFDEVAVGGVFGDGIEQIEGPDDVISLGVDGVAAVNHRVRSTALLTKMHDGVRSEAFEGWFKKRIVAQIADKQIDVLAGKLVPEGDAFVDGGNGDEAVSTEFVIVAAPD